LSDARQARAESISVRNGVEVEFFDKLQVFVIFNAVFERLDGSQAGGILIVEASFVFFQMVVYDERGAFFYLVESVGKTEVFNIPWHGFFVAAALF
jgi:hypothetical protein